MYEPYYVLYRYNLILFMIEMRHITMYSTITCRGGWFIKEEFHAHFLEALQRGCAHTSRVKLQIFTLLKQERILSCPPICTLLCCGAVAGCSRLQIRYILFCGPFQQKCEKSAAISGFFMPLLRHKYVYADLGEKMSALSMGTLETSLFPMG